MLVTIQAADIVHCPGSSGNNRVEKNKIHNTADQINPNGM